MYEFLAYVFIGGCLSVWMDNNRTLSNNVEYIRTQTDDLNHKVSNLESRLHTLTNALKHETRVT